MLAYLFWHRPSPAAPAATYEAALVTFHRRLAEAAAPGLRASAAYRISATPWLGGREGYEDWYLVDASWALDPLNRWAVTGPMEAPHAAVAGLMETGAGGLYSLVWGEPAVPLRSAVAWLTRPRGVRYEPVLAELREQLGGPLICWRRQMVLGPAPEFALVGPPTLDPIPPPGWQALRVERTCLWPMA